MSTINCPSCGHELNVDALSGEPRPCSQCGSIPTIDESGNLIPDSEHQGNINRQKFFEIATVIVLIIVGFGYFAISNGSIGSAANGSTTISDLSAILRAENFDERETATALDQSFQRFHAAGELFQTSVDLVSVNGSDQTDAIIFSVGLPIGIALPSNDIAEKATQEAFDNVTQLGELLVPTSTQGLSKAVNTTVPVSNDNTKFRKGVAQTNNGWKITYIAYRAMENNETETPFLLFIYQRLDAASDPALQRFNQIVFTAANEGANIFSALQKNETGDSVEN